MSAAAVVALGASVIHVPRGSVAILSWRGGGTPALLPPGLAWRIPILQQIFMYTGGAVVAEGSLAAASREGTAVTLSFFVQATPTPQGLLALHQEGGSGGAPAALRRLAEQQLVKSAAATGTYDLASGTSLREIETLVGRTLKERLECPVALVLSHPVVPPEVRASFRREAVLGRMRTTPFRVLLVGLDGADWRAIDPLLARGQLPNLARLKRAGSWAVLRSSVPTLSPLLWTTVATGKSPDRHGINDFLVADPRTGRQVPINSSFRKAKALWNILTDAGLSSDIVAWWATWPAEAIHGHLISDRVAYSTFNVSGPEGQKGAVYPEGYAAEVARLKVREEEVTYERVARFLHIGAAEFRRARALASRKEPAGEAEESINLLVRVLAATETYRAIALDLLRRGEGPPARLFAVYFQGLDEVNHRFAHCSPPRHPLCPAPDYRRFRDAVAEFYRYQDEVLGEIMKEAGESTVLVISDHGFASGKSRPDDVKPFIEGRPGLWHDLQGIFVAHGPGVARGALPAVTLYDIAPTILHLLGLPVPEDMPGKVLEAALDATSPAGNPILRVPSFEGLERAPDGRTPVPPPTTVAEGGAPAGDAAEEEILAQLRSLGYVGGAPAAVPSLLYHTNLGAVYVGKKQFDLAEAEFRKALSIDPRSLQALTGMAILHEAKGEPERALEVLRAVLRSDPGDDPGILIELAGLYIRIGRAADGLTYMKGLQPRPGGSRKRELGLRISLGMLHAAAGGLPEAERWFLQALDLDPASVLAMQELFALYDAQGRAPDLELRLGAALASDPRSPMHHNWLGLVRKRQRDLKGAEEEFRKTLELAPDLAGAMANLGSLCLQQQRYGEAVAILRRAVDKDPRNLESRTNLIVALGMTRDLPGARTLVEEAESAGRRTPLLYNALAYALHVNGRDEEALAWLRRSLQIDPRQADALRLQAEIERGPTAGSPYR
jgi:predicted AlkP superfamily phosphohydrolase/phosphomutase/tetratricopeptide (TPR) repeat protein